MDPLQSSVFHPSTTLNQSIQASSLSSQPISTSVPSDSTAQGSQSQPPLLSDHTAFLPPPSQCRPYSSLQMLSSLRSTPSTGSGLVGTIPTQGHPRVTTSSGFPSMTTIARSNQTRLEHASISLPRDPPKKRRGKATKPPSIGQPLAPTVRDCISQAEGGVEVANVDLLVYPPMPPTSVQNQFKLPRQPYIYHRNAESFKLILGQLGLYFEFNYLPTTTLIHDILAYATTQIREKYTPEALIDINIPLTGHERLPLQLLAFTNRGRATGVYMAPRLTTVSFPATMSLHNLMWNTKDFAIDKWAVSGRNHFQIHAIIRNHPFEVRFSLSNVHLGQDVNIRTHRCLSKRIYKMFAHDSDASFQIPTEEDEEMEESCEELDDSSEDNEASSIFKL
ncbi:hypothetical protein F5879DRAFT_802377 [Lentinula edodes]|nr:hypothetical protein F5879DRAFT_802377 [Lentinula edodes]